MKRYLERNEYREVMLSYSQIEYQKLVLRNHTSKERNQRKELSIKILRKIILKE